MKPIIELSQVLQDSPKFREVLEENEENIEEFEGKLEKLVKLCQHMLDNGKTYQNAKQSFLSGVKELSTHFKEDEVVYSSLSQILDVLQELETYNTILLDQMHRAVVKNLQSFIKSDIKNVKDTKRYFDKISDDLDNSLQRNSQTSRSKQQEGEEVQNVLAAFRSCFRHTALDYICQISCLQSRKRFEVLECFLSLMNAYSTYFHQGSELFGDAEPALKQVATDITSIQEETAELTRELDGRHNIVTSKDIVPILVKDPSSSKNGVKIEGYLFKRTSNAFKTWNRRWFKIENNQLVYRKRCHDDLTVMEEDLKLCAVKPVFEVDRRFCFEVVSPSKNHVLQADSEESYLQWITALQEGINCALHHTMKGMNSLDPGSVNALEGSSESLSSNQSSSSQASENKVNNVHSMVLSVPGNDICCDCRWKDPKWASINLGVTLCIECSGIHRGLGVHVSKVRSLTLDAWEPELLRVMTSLGNKLANQVYEAHLNKVISEEGVNLKRATPSSSRQEREAFIKAKYVDKLFVDPLSSNTFKESTPPAEKQIIIDPNCQSPETSSLPKQKNTTENDAISKSPSNTNSQDSLKDSRDSPSIQKCSPGLNNDDSSLESNTSQKDESPIAKQNLNQLLYNASTRNDLKVMFQTLAMGANSNWQNPNDNGRYPLHQTILTDSMTCTEFLLLNNTKCNVQDFDLKTPLHLAAELGRTGLVCLLLKRGANQHLKDKSGQDALSAAITTANADIVTLLRLSRFNEEMRNEEFGSPGDDTFNEVVRDFSHMASHFPEKLLRKQE